jgi:predicted CoA-binding protein
MPIPIAIPIMLLVGSLAPPRTVVRQHLRKGLDWGQRRLPSTPAQVYPCRVMELLPVHLPLQRILDASSDPENPSAEALRTLFETIARIAVVGLSRDPVKAARRVPSYLAAKGYEVIPVNPLADRILGKASHASLGDVTEPVDMVLVFRPSDEAGRLVAAAAGRKERPVIWLQEGISADTEVRAARQAGLVVVQDLCAYKVHRALSS